MNTQEMTGPASEAARPTASVYFPKLTLLALLQIWGTMTATNFFGDCWFHPDSSIDVPDRIDVYGWPYEFGQWRLFEERWLSWSWTAFAANVVIQLLGASLFLGCVWSIRLDRYRSRVVDLWLLTFVGILVCLVLRLDLSRSFGPTRLVWSAFNGLCASISIGLVSLYFNRKT